MNDAQSEPQVGHAGAAAPAGADDHGSPATSGAPRGGVLAGITVLDFSIAMAGPLAAQRFGDLGADVIKVEPVTGEWQRHTSAGGAQGNRINVSFLSMNRNKRSLAINLKDPAAREVVERLVRSADVFLQNYRPGVATRLGVDYETLHELNPGLVYVSISGYGEDGPLKDRPGQDMLLQAMSGTMYSVGSDTLPPTPAGLYLVDSVTAATAFEGGLAALLHRERTGAGQLVQVNMLDVITTLQMQELSVFTIGHMPQKRSRAPHGHVYIRAPYGAFNTADGHIVLAFPDLTALGEAIDEPAFAGLESEDAGWTMRDEIWDRTQAKLVGDTSANWLARFDAAGLWAGPVLDYAQLVENEQIVHNKTFVTYDHPTEGRITTPGFPYKMSATPPAIHLPTPLTGQQTPEVLAELGYSPDEIDAMESSGLVTTTSFED